jgi:hypothetical protein
LSNRYHSNPTDTSRHHRDMHGQQFEREDSRRPRRGSESDMQRDMQREMQREMQRGMGPDFPPGAPGMGQMPRTAPPNFTPEGPGMERGQLGIPGQGPEQFGAPRRGGGGLPPNRPRELQRCVNRFTYIWLINGSNFWFFPTFVGRQFVQGFRWRRNRWEFESINLRRIFFFRCF